MPKVYVIILNYQTYIDTIIYVKQLQKQKHIDLNILIVDNCSPNNSYKHLREALSQINNIEIIKSKKNGGYAYGNNYGLRHIEKIVFDFVLISNNDIFIENDSLICQLVENYKSLNNPAFIAPIMNTNGKVNKNTAWKIPSLYDDIYSTLKVLNFFLNPSNFYEFDGKSNIKVDCLAGSFFISKKNIFYEINLFDEKTFLYGEERILAYKVKKEGLQNYLIQNLNYEHYESQTISQEIRSSTMFKYLFQSRLYFHKECMKEEKNKLILYKIIFKLSLIELFFMNILKKIIGK